jgi:hypothetical protein
MRSRIHASLPISYSLTGCSYPLCRVFSPI